QRPTIVWSGRHADPRKNTPLLLRAFARLARSVPQARLRLLGPGLECMAPLTRTLGIQEQVESLGFVDAAQLPELLRQASVFAIPSDQEGLCISALEGMACGLPVVSTRCGGPEAFVLPGQTGLLVE